MNRATQAERILTLLRSHEWVSLSDILDLRVAKYSSRITELRHRGYVILNRKEEAADGTVHSWYRLAGEPELPTCTHRSLAEKCVDPSEQVTGQKELFA